MTPVAMTPKKTAGAPYLSLHFSKQLQRNYKIHWKTLYLYFRQFIKHIPEEMWPYKHQKSAKNTAEKTRPPASICTKMNLDWEQRALCWWDLESECLMEGEWVFWAPTGFFLKAFKPFGVFLVLDSRFISLVGVSWASTGSHLLWDDRQWPPLVGLQ